MTPIAISRAATLAALVLAAACGGKRAPVLPSAGGTPFPEAAAAYTEATTHCRGVRTLSAELGLSGKAGGQKLRGRILGGFAESGKVRLEAPAPFGRPIFTLAMHDDAATLVLNREGRVLRGAKPAELIEALTGVALGPDELRAAIAGCGFGAGEQAAGGESYPGDWATIDVASSKVWLRKVSGAWRLVASSRDGLDVRYDEFASGRPSAVRLIATGANAGSTDLTLRLAQVDINTTIDPAAFDVEVPSDAKPLTLEELRRAGPLGATGGTSDPQ